MGRIVVFSKWDELPLGTNCRFLEFGTNCRLGRIVAQPSRRQQDKNVSFRRPVQGSNKTGTFCELKMKFIATLKFRCQIGCLQLFGTLAYQLDIYSTTPSLRKKSLQSLFIVTSNHIAGKNDECKAQT